MNKILLFEDDPAIRLAVSESLSNEHFDVSEAENGERGLNLATKGNNDLIILDLILPDIDGIEVCKTLRASGIRVPIIMLTSRKDDVDKILGLEIGADDYITKPFNMRELIARIKALLRRVTFDSGEI